MLCMLGSHAVPALLKCDPHPQLSARMTQLPVAHAMYAVLSSWACFALVVEATTCKDGTQASQDRSCFALA